jgi:hypothetical protein
MRFVRVFSFLLLVLALLTAASDGAGRPSAQSRAGNAREFSLNDRVFVSLMADWLERRDVPPPPAPVLVASAPRLRFSDILVLENRVAPAVLEFAFSDNPYIGQDSRALETSLQVRAGAVPHLFYFFFPPPAGCLGKALEAFEKAKQEADAQRERERAEARENEKPPPPSTPPGVTISARCDFGPEPRDFFSEQVSPSVVFSRSGTSERVRGDLRELYMPPMEQVEIGEMTFLIFEAQGQRTVDRADVERYGFPDSTVGARVHFFWAIGARTPFPFIRDPHRKDLQLVHVVYATLSLSGDARPEFRDLLRRIRVQM